MPKNRPTAHRTCASTYCTLRTASDVLRRILDSVTFCSVCLQYMWKGYITTVSMLISHSLNGCFSSFSSFENQDPGHIITKILDCDERCRTIDAILCRDSRVSFRAVFYLYFILSYFTVFYGKVACIENPNMHIRGTRNQVLVRPKSIYSVGSGAA
jgi:hypothetical protein